ncbi:hypothetical protein EJ08DRAFT_518941 [Tothia fuscella]|uniref:Extracellular serine-rich protein n=1 Tax=Tothia fuscella TaxID=1048955 RepID=A0A9P4NGX5_9PEZI|nr:hypothetical protein EJ08DRAFT_518941 [Tothia fuscella]
MNDCSPPSSRSIFILHQPCTTLALSYRITMAKLSVLPVALALLVLNHFNFAAAQITSSTGSKPAQTYVVKVGINHQFQPEVIQALPGDTVKFDFMPLNHSVVRAEYKYPCIPYEKTGAGKIGFFSGFRPATAILDNPPSWSIKINDSDPILFYCSAPGSCINYEMVGIINPNATTVLATQKDLASKSKFVMQPGEDFPPEAAEIDKPNTPSSTKSSVTTVTATPAASSSAAAVHTKSGLSGGAIAGIAVGGVFVLGLAAALMFFIGRSKTLKETVNRQSQMPPNFPNNHDQPMYQTGFAPMKSPDFHRSSQVGQHEVNQFGHPGHMSMDTAYSAGYSTPRDGGSPPPQFQPHGTPVMVGRQEYRYS